MSHKIKPYLTFLALSLLLFYAATYGLDAIYGATIYAYTGGEGMLFLLVPWLLLGWMVSWTTSRAGLHTGFIVLGVGAFLMGYAYWYGYHGSLIALQKHAWTAAALSLGFIPFVSGGLLVGIGILSLFLVHRRRTNDNE